MTHPECEEAFDEFAVTKPYLQVEKELSKLVERAFVIGYCTAQARYKQEQEKE